MSELLERLSVVLAARYRIERELGQGGMAKVFLAKFGGDTFDETKQRFDAYRKQLEQYAK